MTTLPLHRLSDRECTIWRMATNSMTTPQIANILNLSPATVKTVRRNINRKLRK